MKLRNLTLSTLLLGLCAMLLVVVPVAHAQTTVPANSAINKVTPIVQNVTPVAVSSAANVQTAIQSGDPAEIGAAVSSAITATSAAVAQNTSGQTSQVAQQVSLWSALISPIAMLILALFGKKTIQNTATQVAASNSQAIQSMAASHAQALVAVANAGNSTSA